MRVYIGATWRIRLNGPCASAMQPFCQITLATLSLVEMSSAVSVNKLRHYWYHLRLACIWKNILHCHKGYNMPMHINTVFVSNVPRLSVGWHTIQLQLWVTLRSWCHASVIIEEKTALVLQRLLIIVLYIPDHACGLQSLPSERLLYLPTLRQRRLRQPNMTTTIRSVETLVPPFRRQLISLYNLTCKNCTISYIVDLYSAVYVMFISKALRYRRI